MRAVRVTVLIGLMASGCENVPLPADMAASLDATTPPDSGTPPRDLAPRPPDLSPLPPDLTPPPDLIPGPDLYAPDFYFDPAQCGPFPDFAVPPSCTDGVVNQDETDIDCGGMKCAKCADGLSCKAAGDCKSGICQNGKCVGCSDGVKDQDETDVDCGGKTCAPCRFGKACIVAGDCYSAVCTNGQCAAPKTCADGKYDGLETDVDCGGPCAPCPTDKHCMTKADCAKDPCAKNVCTSCSDGFKDGDESDVDCGGSCPGCGGGGICRTDSDCGSGTSCVNGNCRYQRHCFDHRVDADETDVDCGGMDCVYCGVCRVCRIDGDCASGRCIGNRCGPPLCLLPFTLKPAPPGFHCISYGAGEDAWCDWRSCAGCCNSDSCDLNGSANWQGQCCQALPPAWCDGHGNVVGPVPCLNHCEGCCNGAALEDCVPYDMGISMNALCGPTFDSCQVCPIGTQCTNGVCQPL